MKNHIRLFPALVSLMMLCCFLTSCSGNKDGSSSSETSSAVSSDTQAADSSAEETTAETEETELQTEPPHVSPVENISFSSGSEVSDINEIMDYESNKNYKISLDKFADEGDIIDSFTFVFYSADNSSNIGEYTGGCGISVSSDCPSATDDGWYQSEDFKVSVNGSYAEIKWDVPSDIKDYIEISENGFVQIGYWWSNVQKLKLSSIICNYSVNASIPVDNTVSADIGQELYYGTEQSRTCHIPLSSLITDGDIPQLFTFRINASGSLEKFSGAFGISLEDGCPYETDKNWYQTGNVAAVTDSSSVELTWLVPDGIKDYISSSGELMLGYWWSACDNITLESVSVKYSNDGSEKTPAATVQNNSNSVKSDKPVGEMSSAEIVEDMKIGWNLGNTLECYDIKSGGNAETAWGNPVTTKDMIDTVKAAGFNAVRIPVSWNDHMNAEFLIDSPWIKRVQEIVDYAFDNDMYVIINVHHDDYTWLNPTYADQQEVTKKYTAIWKQVCNVFKDYDEHLLFEGLNEPRVIGGENEWTSGTAEERDVINQLLQTFVDTVRNSEGYNKTRHLIVTTHAASIDSEAVKGLEVPDDERIIVSVHYYSPWDFAGDESDKADWGSDADKKALDEGFDLLYNTFVKNDIPVIIGEFGAVGKNNDSVRADYYKYYIESAAKRNITCFVWDDGGKFKMLNRVSLQWYYPSIINNAVNAAD